MPPHRTGRDLVVVASLPSHPSLRTTRRLSSASVAIASARRTRRGEPSSPRPKFTPVALLTRPLEDGLSLGAHLIAGFCATAAAVFAMHPLDTVKTLMQRAETTTLSVSAAATGVASRRTLANTIRGVAQESGFLGFYSGLVANVGAQAPAGAIKFSVYESLTQWAHKRFDRKYHSWLELACGAMAFVACSGVLVPGEVMKQRMQAGVYRSMGEGVREILQTEGVRGLFTGYRATLIRDIPYTMCEFGFYAQFKRLARAVMKKDKLTPRQELVLGGFAGGITGLVTTPLDVAKTKVMTQAHVAASEQYKNVADCLVRVAREEGISGLLQGSSARVAWLIPFTAIYFGVHEAAKRRLKARSVAPTPAVG